MTEAERASRIDAMRRLAERLEGRGLVHVPLGRLRLAIADELELSQVAPGRENELAETIARRIMRDVL